jgi:hypothetical protein
MLLETGAGDDFRRTGASGLRLIPYYPAPGPRNASAASA